MTGRSDALVMEVRIDAHPSRVYEAWTRSDEAATWMWASLSEDVTAEMDAREGGPYAVSTARSGGERWALRGVFTRLDPPRCIEATLEWTAPMGYDTAGESIRVALEADGEGTCMTFEHRGVPAGVPQDQHRAGWGEAFEYLARHLRGEMP